MFTQDERTGFLVDEAGVPLLSQPDEDGFVDCVFKIEGVEQVGDFLQFEMRAEFDDAPVGFSAQVFRGIGPGLESAEAGMTIREGGVYRPAVVLRTLGAQSDRFLNSYLSLCGLESEQPLSFTEALPLTGIALHQDAIDILAEPVRIKVFGNDSEEADPNRYFELFFNLDIPSGYACLNEKDPEYRIATVTSFAC